MKKYLLLSLLLLPNLTLAVGISDFNPVSHWTCNETSGVRYDSNTTNSNDLTDNNTVSYATGLLGNACDFESGSSEYLSYADDAYFEFDNSFTFSYWAKLESDVDGIVIGKWNNTSQGFWVQNTGTGDVTLRYTDEDQNTADKAGMNEIGTWHHIVLQYDAGTVKYWQDGVYQTPAISVSNQTITDGSAIFTIGKTQFFNSNYYDGLLDEIALFDDILATSTIEDLYNAGTPLCYSCSFPEPPATSSTSTTATSTSTLEDDNIVFMLGIIAFFLTFLWFGFIVNAFKKI